ncbi:MFS transporter [Streptacidiphilus fuscans]|uniref:MFS transporter n=1 Tax=Streptacidiphilus fuscans TaxID=2789292 RepID=A0A931FD68_9ACTN|nr:MFS transporter [Streptacidiphilus fuscans]MBF9067221.1 MFS transporter [Streptacidiphilus fuscans]
MTTGVDESVLAGESGEEGDARLGAAFAKLWGSSTASALGSGLTTIATPLLVASRTSDPLIVASASAVAWLPWLLFALPGGVLVDRVDRRRLMVALDWGRFAAMGVLSLTLLTGHPSIVVLYSVLFLINTGEVVFRSAAQSLVQTVVPRPLLERANGWLTGGTTLMQGVLSGPLGGLLFAVTAGLPFLVNTGTYAASALLIAMVAGSFRPEASSANADGDADTVADKGRRSVWRDMAKGFRWLMRQRLLRTMALLIGLLNVTLTAAVAVLVLLAKERLHLGSVGYGVLFSCMAVGGIVGSAIGDRLVAWCTATWTIRIGLLIEAAMHLALATSHSAWLLGVMLFAFGVHGVLWGIVANSLRQRMTPPELMGRVSSSNLFIAAGGNCVGALLGGGLASRFGVAAPYWVGFVVAVGVIAATWHVFDRESVAAAYATDPAQATTAG